jgi:hypothetical protein
MLNLKVELNMHILHISGHTHFAYFAYFGPCIFCIFWISLFYTEYFLLGNHSLLDSDILITILLLLPFLLGNLMHDKVAAHDLKDQFQPIHNQSRKLVGMVLLLLSWIHGICSSEANAFNGQGGYQDIEGTGRRVRLSTSSSTLL